MVAPGFAFEGWKTALLPAAPHCAFPQHRLSPQQICLRIHADGVAGRGGHVNVDSVIEKPQLL